VQVRPDSIYTAGTGSSLEAGGRKILNCIGTPQLELVCFTFTTTPPCIAY
jgi:hypothetical protein